MTQNQKDKKEYKSWKKNYYHLSSDGWKEGLLFNTTEQYANGMTLMGVITLRFDIKVYAFSLMPNHFHILTSGNGAAISDAFAYLKRKLNQRLQEDGFPLLERNYGFKLVPVKDPEQMKTNFIYIDRNAYERQYCVPGGYPWSSCRLQFSRLDDFSEGVCAESISKRKLEELIGTRLPIPGQWRFHPVYGLLPSSFVDTSLFHRLFSGPKEYLTRLVKDYEAYVKIARELDETPVFSKEEADEMARTILRERFPGKAFAMLTHDEKGILAVSMAKQYSLPATLIAEALRLSERTVLQLLRAKDYGNIR